MGIIVKKVIEPRNAALHESGYWMEKFANFKPLDVHTVWNEHDHTIWGIVKFNEDRNGFMTTSNFEIKKKEKRRRKTYHRRRETKGKTKTYQSGYWLEKFANFKPLDVHKVWNEHHHTIWRIVKFNEDWNGFMTTSNSQKSFETVNLGKRDWKERQWNPGLRTYGWGGRADDYTAEDPIGEYLRNSMITFLKTS